MRRDAFLTRNDDNAKYECSYYHNPIRWNDNMFSFTGPFLQEENWSKLYKYLNSDNNGISDEINNLPDNTGGVYLFFIQGATIPFAERYLAYIGRSKYTDNQNIKKRAKEYLLESKKNNPRPKIEKLFKYWKEYLYFRYFPSNDNSLIDQSENSLIRAILPPFNDEIPDKLEFKEPKSAFLL